MTIDLCALTARLESLRQKHLALAEEHEAVTREVETLLADRQALRDQLEAEPRELPKPAE